VVPAKEGIARSGGMQAEIFVVCRGLRKGSMLSNFEDFL
jgi:hypothetical protein